MKRFLRLCSMILTVVMVLNMLPLQSFAVTIQENITDDDTVTLKPSAEEETIVGEIVSARSEYSKEYLLSNGLHLAKVYSEPVHYEKDGAWEEIDNTLKRTTAGTYSNTAGLWNVQFPQKMGANAPVAITKDGYTLSFAMAGDLRNWEVFRELYFRFFHVMIITEEQP